MFGVLLCLCFLVSVIPASMTLETESQTLSTNEEIYRRAKSISEELEGIIRWRSNLLYPQSAPPVKNRTKCTVSKEELTSLREQIKDIMRNVSSSQGKCGTEEATQLDNCNAWLRLIQCGILQLGEGFRNATSRSADLESITKWKNAYDGLLERYRKEVDDVRASLSEEYKRKLDVLTTQLQELSALIAKTGRELRHAYLELCVSELAAGKSDRAAEYFRQLANDSKLPEIVSKAYSDYGQASVAPHIVQFLQALPRCELDRVGYPHLFQLMSAGRKLTKPEATLLHDAARPCLCRSTLLKELEKIMK